MDLVPGTVIAGRYRADRRIGVGGMGEVWAGVRLSDSEPVAIKVLLALELGDGMEAGEALARFRREAMVLARVRSEYVGTVLDFLTEEDELVLVMELIPGESFHAVLSRSAHVSIEDTLDIASDVLRGLGDLHQAGIVHRDLKPGNIVLRQRPGKRPRATLIDFGVSRIMSPLDNGVEDITAITQCDRVLGTLEYMAPEQILGSGSVTGTADLYALGAVMFRAIMGHHVFGSLQEGHLARAKLNEDPPAINTGRSDEVAQRTALLISRLLARATSSRFKTAEEAMAEVDAIRALARSDASLLSESSEDDQPSIELHSRSGAAHMPRASQSGQSKRSRYRSAIAAFLLFTLGSIVGGLCGQSYGDGGIVYRFFSLLGMSSDIDLVERVDSGVGAVPGSHGVVPTGSARGKGAAFSD